LRLAAEGGFGKTTLCGDIAKLLPSFERGKCGRILSIAAPAIWRSLHVRNQEEWFKMAIDRGHFTVGRLERVLELHDAMMCRARRAIDCWSMAARRGGVVKDMRVMIAKLLWAEVWRWGEKENAQDVKKTKRS
jgi:hypothetical protein